MPNVSTASDAGTWHQREVRELINEHAVDPDQGLRPAEVDRRMGIHGPNEMWRRRANPTLADAVDTP